MNRKIRVLGIAPYEALKNTMIRVANERSDVELTVEVGNIEAGAAIARKYENENFDAILSRGGTMLEVEKVTSKPVFDVPISHQDLLNVIRLVEHYKGKVAILAYQNIAKSAAALCGILHYHYDIFIIDSWRAAKEMVKEVKKQGYSLIIGDMVSTVQAEEEGIQSMLLISGTESVRQAFDTVVGICRHYAKVSEENTFFHAFMRSRENEALAMDENGNVVFSTFSAEKRSLLAACRNMIPTIRAGDSSVIYKKSSNGLLMVSGSKNRLMGATYFFFSVQKNNLTLSYLSGYKSIEIYNAEDLLHQGIDPHSFGENLSPDLRRQSLSISKSNAPVLITGEPGTEKEILAAHIYLNSAEVKNPYFIVNCAALTAKELENFLSSPNSPLYALLGTVHFKGVHRLSASLFNRLLMGLQGMSRMLRCRLILTYELHSPHAAMEDSALRINAVKRQIGCMEIPLLPLRECVDNIANLAVLHIHQQNRLRGSSIVGLEPESISLLEQYPWPQNLNQLRRVLNEAMLCASSMWISAKDIRRILSAENGPEAPVRRGTVNLNQSLAAIEYEAAMLVLAEENMNQVRTAKRLGISRTTLWRLLRKGPGK